MLLVLSSQDLRIEDLRIDLFHFFCIEEMCCHNNGEYLDSPIPSITQYHKPCFESSDFFILCRWVNL
jgi:hypothetical protein